MQAGSADMKAMADGLARCGKSHTSFPPRADMPQVPLAYLNVCREGPLRWNNIDQTTKPSMISL
jgi:hypothetical protein